MSQSPLPNPTSRIRAFRGKDNGMPMVAGGGRPTTLQTARPTDVNNLFHAESQYTWQ